MSPLLAVVFILSLLAQGDTGQLSGTVVDANGAVVVSANVKLTSQSTSQVREVITGESGEFAFPLLPPGRYNVEVSANGFRTVLIDDANVNITQTTTLLVHLDAAIVAGGRYDQRRPAVGPTRVFANRTRHRRRHDSPVASAHTQLSAVADTLTRHVSQCLQQHRARSRRRNHLRQRPTHH